MNISCITLYPSEIVYSQSTINACFDCRSGHPNKKIGETLDDICEGRCSIHEIPRISVIRQDNEWVTLDNRRLWVFKCLESLGRCGKITVNVVDSISSRKMTTKTGGKTVIVRGDPGGRWHHRAELTDDDDDDDDDDDGSYSTGSSGAQMKQSHESSFGSKVATGVLIGGAAALACRWLFSSGTHKDKH